MEKKCAFLFIYVVKGWNMSGNIILIISYLHFASQNIFYSHI